MVFQSGGRFLITCIFYHGDRHTSAWNGNDTLTNCNKVEHAKISKYNSKQSQESKNFENPPPSAPLAAIFRFGHFLTQMPYFQTCFSSNSDM